MEEWLFFLLFAWVFGVRGLLALGYLLFAAVVGMLALFNPIYGDYAWIFASVLAASVLCVGAGHLISLGRPTRHVVDERAAAHETQALLRRLGK